MQLQRVICTCQSFVHLRTTDLISYMSEYYTANESPRYLHSRHSKYYPTALMLRHIIVESKQNKYFKLNIVARFHNIELLFSIILKFTALK